MSSFTGRLGRDPERTGDRVKFSVAVDNAHVDATQDSSNPKRGTLWLNVTAWDREADRCAKLGRKGSLVLVTGAFSVREYMGKDGSRKWSADLNLWHVEFLSGFGQPKVEPGKENGFQPQPDDGEAPF